MRAILAAVVVLASACSAWHVKYPGELAPEPGEAPNRGYVVTQSGEAYELDVAARDSHWLHGIVRKHWSVGWDQNMDRAEAPEDTAERLGWPTDESDEGQAISIPIYTVKHARVYERDERRVFGWVGGSIATVMLAFCAAIVIAGTAGGGMSGRPLRVRGKQQFARPVTSNAWSSAPSRAPITAMDDATRVTLSAIWIFDAQAEHSSIAAFSKLSLDLLALGAPPSLVQRTHAAAVEEIEHARLCFALASAYRGTPIGPGPLPGATSGEPASLDRLARETLIDGCVGETVAAEAARLGSLTATDPAVRELQSIIAADEAGHAALAWDIVEWCLDQDPSLRRPLVDALASVAMPTHAPHLPSHGRHGGETLRALTRDAIAAAHERLAATDMPLALSA